jgi:hypothetical protein
MCEKRIKFPVKLADLFDLFRCTHRNLLVITPGTILGIPMILLPVKGVEFSFATVPARLVCYRATERGPHSGSQWFYGTRGFRQPVPVLVDRETCPFQGTSPGRIHEYPAAVDPHTACKVVSNGKAGRQPAEFRRIQDIRVIPEEGDSGIDHLKSQSPVHLRKKVVFWTAGPLPEIKDLLRGGS